MTLTMGAEIVTICLILSIRAASSTSIITQTNVTSVSSTLVSLPSSTSGPSVLPVSSSQSVLPITSSQSAFSGSASQFGSSSTSQPILSTTNQQGFLSSKPPSSYEVTENVIDIPDNRTLPPIVPNYNIFKPINVANTTFSVNKITKNDKGDEHNQIKKTSFTYVHFNKETNSESGIKKLFKGIKNYVFNLKRGVVDGLHSYFHKHDKKENESGGNVNKDKTDKEQSWDIKFLRSDPQDGLKEDDFRHKFHRSYHDYANFDEDDNVDDVFKDEFDDY